MYYKGAKFGDNMSSGFVLECTRTYTHTHACNYTEPLQDYRLYHAFEYVGNIAYSNTDSCLHD